MAGMYETFVPLISYGSYFCIYFPGNITDNNILKAQIFRTLSEKVLSVSR